MPIASERKDETALFERIRQLETLVEAQKEMLDAVNAYHSASLADLMVRIAELEAGKGM